MDEEVNKTQETPNPRRLPTMKAVIGLHDAQLKDMLDSKHKELADRMAMASLAQMVLDLESDGRVAETYLKAGCGSDIL